MSRTANFLKTCKPLYGLICLTLFACSAVPPKKTTEEPVSHKSISNPWAAVKKPVLLGTKPEVFGFYTRGCLSGAVELPVSAPFWEVVNASRNRYYAHPDSVAFLEKLGAFTFKHGKLLLGDISQPAGGPTSFGHTSHQLGLDIDIRFGFAHAALTPEQREGFPMTAVAMHYMEIRDEPAGRQFRLVNEILPEWKPVYGELVRESAVYPRVERIFVSPPIKNQLCSQFRVANGRGGFTYPAWLRKVRPYFEHNAHFHVRLLCPADSAGCEPQKPNAPDHSDSTGVGCSGLEFAWWFESDPTQPGYLKDSMDDEIKRGGVPAPLESLDWESKHKLLPPACLELLKKAQISEIPTENK